MPIWVFGVGMHRYSMCEHVSLDATLQREQLRTRPVEIGSLLAEAEA